MRDYQVERLQQVRAKLQELLGKRVTVSVCVPNDQVEQIVLKTSNRTIILTADSDRRDGGFFTAKES